MFCTLTPLRLRGGPCRQGPHAEERAERANRGAGTPARHHRQQGSQVRPVRCWLLHAARCRLPDPRAVHAGRGDAACLYVLTDRQTLLFRLKGGAKVGVPRIQAL